MEEQAEEEEARWIQTQHSDAQYRPRTGADTRVTVRTQCGPGAQGMRPGAPRLSAVSCVWAHSQAMWCGMWPRALHAHAAFVLIMWILRKIT